MKEKTIFLGITIVMLIVVIGSSYAFLSTQSESSKNHIVKAGKLEISFVNDDSKINLEGSYPISDAEGMKGTPHTFTITNTGSLPASYQISLADNTTLYNSHNDTDKIFNENQLKLGITNGNGNTTYQMYKKGSFIEGTLDSGKSATYTIRMWIPEHIGNEVQGFHFHGNIKVDSVQTLGTKNQNITKIYAYNQETGSSTFCVTGEESTCKEIKNAPATYEIGTIVKYKVNEAEEKYFFVMSDNGDTLTLQQRENTIFNVAWNVENFDTTKGPVTVVNALENATLEWKNVKSQTYSLNEKLKISNARLITKQEMSSAGCTWNPQSCPVWMYNYLSDSMTYGGTVNQSGPNGNASYWTMSANENDMTLAWSIYYRGQMNTDNPATLVNGARAVVEINKLDKEAIKTVARNENILAVYQYDEVSDSSTFCVTGEESTCKMIYPTTYESGTIVQFKLNDYTVKYFHVMYDNGDTLTLQQRENTINQISWGTNASNGPMIVLPALEDATVRWTNVIDQTYTLGTTIFKDNAYTGCDFNMSTGITCTNNKYTLGQRTAKARLILVQEALSFGCTSEPQSCPVWMHNYLDGSINAGGTVNGIDANYWTSNGDSSSDKFAYRIIVTGSVMGYNIDGNSSTGLNVGARAVITINK